MERKNEKPFCFDDWWAKEKHRLKSKAAWESRTWIDALKKIKHHEPFIFR